MKTKRVTLNAKGKTRTIGSPDSRDQILERDWFSGALKILETQRLLLLVGEPGRSKTTFARWAANQLGCPDPLILQGSPEIEQQHVWGYERLVEGNMRWGDGFLPRALKESKWLIVEDFNQVPLDVRGAFLDLRDNRERITNPLNGEVISVSPANVDDARFRLIATANPESMKCHNNKSLAQSLFDGFVSIPETPALDEDELETLLAMRLPSASAKNVTTALVQWRSYREVRGKKLTGSESNSGDSILTYRSLEQLVQLLESGVPLRQAVEWAVVSKFAIDGDLYSAAKLKLEFE